MTDRRTGPQPADPVEVEWQFDALDLRPVERWLAALPPAPGGVTGTPGPPGVPVDTVPTALAKPARRLVDRYLDTADWRIGRAGFVLRTRRRGRSDEATLKDTRPAGSGGLRERLEVSEPLPEGGVPALGPDGPVGRRVSAVAGQRPFRQVLEVRTRRRPYSLRVAGDEVAEVALDDTVITVGGGEQPVRLRRVEVEVTPEWVDTLQPLVEDLRRTCGLQPATLSKFEAGLLALGVEVPGPPELGPTGVTAESSLGDLAFAVLRLQLGVLLAREPGTRLGEDVEELHDMRVATRRLRAAIDFFAGVLPVRAQALRAELSWLADALGRVRDLDVQIGRMDEMGRWATFGGTGEGSSLDELRDLLEKQRRAARRDLLAALDSLRWERLASGLVVMVQQGQPRRVPPARQPAAIALPELVSARRQAVVKAAKRARHTGAAPDYHRLRIRGKRLRYSLEFTAGVYGGRTERFTRRLAKLQDALGLMQDAEVATTRLLDLAVSASRPGDTAALPPRTVFAMGAVAQRYREEAAALLAKMPKRLALLHGDEWKDLASHMARRRQEAVAAAPPVRPARPAGAAMAAGEGAAMPPPAAPPVPPPPLPIPSGGPAANVAVGAEQVAVGQAARSDQADRTAQPAQPGEVGEVGEVGEIGGSSEVGEVGEPVGSSERDPDGSADQPGSALAAAASAWPDVAWAPPGREVPDRANGTAPGGTGAPG